MHSLPIFSPIRAPLEPVALSTTRQAFNGKQYRETPNGYFKTDDSHIHRDVWEYHMGKIPDGFIVHHMDENRANNSINNLQCMSRKDHSDHHREEVLKSLRGAKVVIQCAHCGQTVTKIKRGINRYCSVKCRANSRNARKLDHEVRQCIRCKRDYSVSRYVKQKFCSHKCYWESMR